MNKSVSLAIEKAVGTLGSKTSSKEFKDNGPTKPDIVFTINPIFILSIT